VLDHDENYSSNNDGSSTTLSIIPETQVHLELSEEFMSLEDLLQESFPVFLYPENNIPGLQDLKRAVKEQKSPEGFVPLISQDQMRQLFEITFDEIAVVYPMFDLSTLNKLNAETHAVSKTHPGGNPARWAIINTWIAMAVRCKTTPGSDDELDCVIKAYYRNAVLVLSDLILQPANKETIQALLFMAVYAEASMDYRSYVMLVTNAVRQIEFLAPRLSEVSDRCEVESCRHSLSFARLHDMKVANKYGMTLLMGSLVF
jgi:Fungal specific transcription factor domain